MLPNFCKKLGPIHIDSIRSTINCKTVNISNEEKFEDFLGITKLKNNSISFIYDNELKIRDIPLNSCIICTKKKARDLKPNQKVIIVDNVLESVAKVSNIFFRDFSKKEISDLSKPIIGENCEIGKNVVIENGAVIGNNVHISHGSVVSHNCTIGNKSKIGSNTFISNAIIGDNVSIENNTSIGQKGFGFLLNNNKNINIYHSGRVIIQSNVSIGSCCTIDRGSFSDTIIGENTYFDNLCHVAHNVEIGRNSAFAAMTGIAGSAKIGNNVLTGGQAGIAGHITIGNNVQIAAKSGVFNSLSDGVSVMGNPAIRKYLYLKKYKKLYD